MSHTIYSIIDPSNTAWERRANAAEQTVGILKTKVRNLQNGTDSGAVQKQIARMRAKQDAAKAKRRNMEVRAQELQKHAQGLEVEVADRTRSLKNILDNVTFGFLIADSDLTIREGFTASCSALLGRNISQGDSLQFALGVSDDDMWKLEMGFEAVFDDIMPEAVTLDQLPSRFEIDDRTLQVEGRLLRKDGRIDGVLLSIMDITALETARRANERNAVVIGILRQRSAFEAFVQDTADLLHAASNQVADQLTVRRLIHTIKGNAGAFGLAGIVHACDEVESELHIRAPEIQRVHDSVHTFLNSIRDIVDIPYRTPPENKVLVSTQALGTLYDQLVELDVPTTTLKTARSMMLRPVSEILGPVETLVERLSEKLQKPVSFVVRGGDTLVNPRQVRPVFRNLAHLIRNSLAHGIEDLEHRGGKPEVASVELRITNQDDETWVEVVDDGQGINSDLVVQRAIAMGFVDPDKARTFSEYQRQELVFEDGLSISQVTTAISGRGVGMSAMKAAVESIGGRIEIHSERHVGTTMRLRIPTAA